MEMWGVAGAWKRGKNTFFHKYKEIHSMKVIKKEDRLASSTRPFQSYKEKKIFNLYSRAPPFLNVHYYVLSKWTTMHRGAAS